MWGGTTKKPQKIKIKRGYTTTGPVIAMPVDRATYGAERYSKPGGRPLLPREDSFTFGIAFYSWYLRLYERLNQRHESVAKRSRHGKNLTSDGHNKVDAISHGCSCLLVLSARYCRIINSGRFLTGGTPAARREDICAVPLHDWLPSTASSQLPRMIPESCFWGEWFQPQMRKIN